MATSYLPLVLEAVEQLDAELLRIHHRLRDVAAWPTSCTTEIASIRASLRRAFKVTRNVREHVLDPRTDEHDLELRGSALRARAILITTQLGALERAARDVPSGDVLDAVVVFRGLVLDHLERVNARWAATSRLSSGGEAAFVFDALEAEFAALSRDTDILTFLSLASSHEHAGIRDACRTLTALLEECALHVPVIPTLQQHQCSKRPINEEA